MTIEIADITDPLFVRLPDDTIKQTYVDGGNSRFSALCLQRGIDESFIATPAPYTPKSIAITCALIAMCEDLVGSDWREIQAGLTIDVYKAKLDVLEKKLQSLLTDFTPKMCGYDVEGDNDATSSVSFSYGRA